MPNAPHRSLKSARLVLASASPRRAMLLRQLGLDFEVAPSGVDETMTGDAGPAALVERLSREKAEEVASRRPDADLVIGADTIVVLDGEVLGKPKDPRDAERMLSAIAGRRHQVFTGYTLVSPRDGRVVTGHVVSAVRIRALSPAEVASYVATGEPLDKAGSYAIQEVGTLLVEGIEGCYTNIVGLPLPAVDAAWRALGWSVL